MWRVNVKSVKDRIRDKLRRAPRGTLFTVSDFDALGSNPSVRKVIAELTKSNELIVVYSGIYQKPNYSKLLKEYIPALPSEIAKKYASKNRWEIAPAGNTALNILGLDTQVPNVYEYISDGPNREIVLDYGQRIKFRHVQQREVKMDSTSSLVIEALKQLGEKNIDDKKLKIVRGRLNEGQMKKLLEDAVSSRVWIRELIKSMEDIDV
jgi:hypothetical protein